MADNKDPPPWPMLAERQRKDGSKYWLFAGAGEDEE